MEVLTITMELGERGTIRRVGGSREVGWLVGRGRKEESWGGEMLRGGLLTVFWGEGGGVAVGGEKEG